MLLVYVVLSAWILYHVFTMSLSLSLSLSFFSLSPPDSPAHRTVDGDTNKVRPTFIYSFRVFTVTILLHTCYNGAKLLLKLWRHLCIQREAFYVECRRCKARVSLLF